MSQLRDQNSSDGIAFEMSREGRQRLQPASAQSRGARTRRCERLLAFPILARVRQKKGGKRGTQAAPDSKQPPEPLRCDR